MKISIITATYHCAATVGACLESVAAQTYADREQIVIDGASPDGTLAVLTARQDQLAVLVSEPDQGIYFALNKGLARASGEVVGVLHADDVYGDAEVLARIAAAGCRPIRPCICAGRCMSGWGALIPASASRRIMT